MLGLALDEPQATDRRVKQRGLTFVIEASLAEQLGRFEPLRVDYDERFFNPLRVIPTRATRCC